MTSAGIAATVSTRFTQSAAMELQAALQSLHLFPPDPLGAAHFYSSTYDMAVTPVQNGYWCQGPGRQLELCTGPANQPHYAQFALHNDAAWQAFVIRVAQLPHHGLPAAFSGSLQAICLKDPDGNRMVFAPPGASAEVAATRVLPAILQHFGMRTARLPAMLDFYMQQLGFVLSDVVKDAAGTLRACFLRTDVMHHALALFFASEGHFDHQSFEAPDWSIMQVPIVWGTGRHGPGNDVFLWFPIPTETLPRSRRRSSIASPAVPPDSGRTRSER